MAVNHLHIHSFVTAGITKYCLLYDPLTVKFANGIIDTTTIYLASATMPWFDSNKLMTMTYMGHRIRAGPLEMFRTGLHAEIVAHCERFYAPMRDRVEIVRALEYTCGVTTLVYQRDIDEFMAVLAGIMPTVTTPVDYNALFDAPTPIVGMSTDMLSPIDINDYVDTAGVYVIAISRGITRMFQYGYIDSLATHILEELRKIRAAGFDAELCLAEASDATPIDMVGRLLEQHNIPSTRYSCAVTSAVTFADITPMMKKYAMRK